MWLCDGREERVTNLLGRGQDVARMEQPVREVDGRGETPELVHRPPVEISTHTEDIRVMVRALTSQMPVLLLAYRNLAPSPLPDSARTGSTHRRRSERSG